MSKRILMILSEWGYWGEELIGPLETFDEQGTRSTSRRRPASAPRRSPEHGPRTTSTRRSAAR